MREKCGAPVLFLTAKAEREDILTGLAAGGNDYITKPYNIDEFKLRVIGLLRLVNTIRAQKTSDEPALLLSQRELDIVQFAANGFSNKDIAKKVFLSESRVKTSLSGIYKKLGILDGRDKRKILGEMGF